MRSVAAGLAEPGMQGPNFTWSETFPTFGAAQTICAFELANCKIHPHHIEEIKQCARMVAAEYQALAHKPALDE